MEEKNYRNKIKWIAGLIIFAAGIAIGTYFVPHLKMMVSSKPSAEPAKETTTAKKEKKILYYRSPMDPNIKSDKPAKDSMGMDFVPVYEGGDDEADTKGLPPGVLKIKPEKIQKLGVKSDHAMYMPLKKTIRAVAKVDYDEKKLSTVNIKVEGYVEKLFVNQTGQFVKRGDALMSIYSPDLVSAQQEYLLALESYKKLKQSPIEEVSRSADTLLEASKKRLKYWDIPESEIRELEKTKNIKKTLTVTSPVNGYVIEKPVLKGMKVMPGENFYKIADLSNVWLYADVYEYEAPFVKTGQKAKITLTSIPGEQFSGRISYIYPFINPETRTLKVRVELPNPGMKFKPEMFANIEIETIISQKALTVPDSAVIDTGTKTLVIVDRGNGTFEPKVVKTGYKVDGYYQILEGLKENEMVIVSANFLIDSESNLKAALSGMSGTPPSGGHEGHGTAPPAKEGKKDVKKDRHKGHSQPSKKEGKKILYYKNPMDPSITSKKPMKDSMGMDYIPVYEGEEETPAKGENKTEHKSH